MQNSVGVGQPLGQLSQGARKPRKVSHQPSGCPTWLGQVKANKASILTGTVPLSHSIGTGEVGQPASESVERTARQSDFTGAVQGTGGS